MPSNIIPFPGQRGPEPQPPTTPCRSCGGRRYTEVWQPGCTSGGAVRCTHCEGTGIEPAGCERCGGTGDVMIGFCSTCIDPFTTCDACDGTGKVAAKESTKELRAELPHCGECMGWGRVWYRDRKGIEWDEQCDSCEGTGYLGTTEQEDQLIEALNWHRGTLRVSSANKMAELASMIDRGQVAELAVAA